MLNDAADVIRRELRSNERLVWSGRPRRGIVFRPADWLTVPFSVMWGGFIVFWEYSVFQNDGPLFFKLWGIPFLLVGAYLFVGRFFHDAYRRSRSFYGLTDQRIIIVSGTGGRTVRATGLDDLNETRLEVRNDETGSIAFGHVP